MFMMAGPLILASPLIFVSTENSIVVVLTF